MFVRERQMMSAKKLLQKCCDHLTTLDAEVPMPDVRVHLQNTTLVRNWNVEEELNHEVSAFLTRLEFFDSREADFLLELNNSCSYHLFSVEEANYFYISYPALMWGFMQLHPDLVRVFWNIEEILLLSATLSKEWKLPSVKAARHLFPPAVPPNLVAALHQDLGGVCSFPWQEVPRVRKGTLNDLKQLPKETWEAMILKSPPNVANCLTHARDRITGLPHIYHPSLPRLFQAGMYFGSWEPVQLATDLARGAVDVSSPVIEKLFSYSDKQLSLFTRTLAQYDNAAALSKAILSTERLPFVKYSYTARLGHLRYALAAAIPLPASHLEPLVTLGTKELEYVEPGISLELLTSHPSWREFPILLARTMLALCKPEDIEKLLKTRSLPEELQPANYGDDPAVLAKYTLEILTSAPLLTEAAMKKRKMCLQLLKSVWPTPQHVPPRYMGAVYGNPRQNPFLALETEIGVSNTAHESHVRATYRMLLATQDVDSILYMATELKLSPASLDRLKLKNILNRSFSPKERRSITETLNSML